MTSEEFTGVVPCDGWEDKKRSAPEKRKRSGGVHTGTKKTGKDIRIFTMAPCIVAHVRVWRGRVGFYGFSRAHGYLPLRLFSARAAVRWLLLQGPSGGTAGQGGFLSTVPAGRYSGINEINRIYPPRGRPFGGGGVHLGRGKESTSHVSWPYFLALIIRPGMFGSFAFQKGGILCILYIIMHDFGNFHAL